MSSEKQMKHVSAWVTDWPALAANNAVSLYGFAVWLKSEPIIEAELTPKEARRLAIALLVAADRVDERARP